MAAIPDYAGILAAVVTVLKADAGIIALLPDGANGIRYQFPNREASFPQVTFFDQLRAGLPLSHEYPAGKAVADVYLDLWGESYHLRPLQALIDSKLESCFLGGAMDTVDWRFADIDTSGSWSRVQVPSEYIVGSAPIEHRQKTFSVRAMAKGSLI